MADQVSFRSTGAYPSHLMAEPHWYALKTRSRSEKVVHRGLVAEGITNYPALINVQRTHRVERLPMFSGYVFVHIRLTQVSDVVSQRGAVTLVRRRHDGVPIWIHEEEMEDVFRLADGCSETLSEAGPAEVFQKGDQVRVIRGPFKGLDGTLVSTAGNHRLVIVFKAIRQARSVQIRREDVTKLVH